MNKSSNVSISFKPTLNRSYVMTSYPNGKAVPFSILYHNRTTALEFQVSKNTIPDNENIKIQMFRNLENCHFCKVFFNIITNKNDREDIRGKFNGIKKEYEQYMIKFCSEKIDLKYRGVDKSSSNSILILGWKLHGYEDDLIFYFIQRKCYNLVSNCNVIRTAGLQFSTPYGDEAISNFEKNIETDITKASEEDVELLKFIESDDEEILVDGNDD